MNQKGVSIEVDDKAVPDDVKINIKMDENQNLITFNASEAVNPDIIDCHCEKSKGLRRIIDAVRKAYIQATTKPF